MNCVGVTHFCLPDLQRTWLTLLCLAREGGDSRPPYPPEDVSVWLDQGDTLLTYRWTLRRRPLASYKFR